MERETFRKRQRKKEKDKEREKAYRREEVIEDEDTERKR
jgi:hypothetical protein